MAKLTTKEGIEIKMGQPPREPKRFFIGYLKECRISYHPQTRQRRVIMTVTLDELEAKTMKGHCLDTLRVGHPISLLQSG